MKDQDTVNQTSVLSKVVFALRIAAFLPLGFSAFIAFLISLFALPFALGTLFGVSSPLPYAWSLAFTAPCIFTLAFIIFPCNLRTKTEFASEVVGEFCFSAMGFCAVGSFALKLLSINGDFGVASEHFWFSLANPAVLILGFAVALFTFAGMKKVEET